MPSSKTSATAFSQPSMTTDGTSDLRIKCFSSIPSEAVLSEPVIEVSCAAALTKDTISAFPESCLVWHSLCTLLNNPAGLPQCLQSPIAPPFFWLLTFEFTGLRGFLRRSGGMVGWAHNYANANRR